MIGIFTRFSAFFRRGHGQYIAFALAIFNFIVIQYKLLIESVPSLNVIFPDILTFSVSFLVIYSVLCLGIGWWDFNKGTIPIEQAYWFDRHPRWVEMHERIKNIEKAVSK